MKLFFSFLKNLKENSTVVSSTFFTAQISVWTDSCLCIIFCCSSFFEISRGILSPLALTEDELALELPFFLLGGFSGFSCFTMWCCWGGWLSAVVGDKVSRGPTLPTPFGAPSSSVVCFDGLYWLSIIATWSTRGPWWSDVMDMGEMSIGWVLESGLCCWGDLVPFWWEAALTFSLSIPAAPLLLYCAEQVRSSFVCPSDLALFWAFFQAVSAWDTRCDCLIISAWPSSSLKKNERRNKNFCRCNRLCRILEEMLLLHFLLLRNIFSKRLFWTTVK